jgi:hypothetical protein
VFEPRPPQPFYKKAGEKGSVQKRERVFARMTTTACFQQDTKADIENQPEIRNNHNQKKPVNSDEEHKQERAIDGTPADPQEGCD